MHHYDSADCPIDRTAGIDWYRAIIRGASGSQTVQDEAVRVLEEDAERGAKITKWAFQGYKGWKAERIRFGVTRKDWLWESSGAASHDISQALAPYGGVVTRLDLQVTYLLSTQRPNFGMQCMRLSTPPRPTSRRSLRKLGLSTDNRGYFLGTVGDRTGDSFWKKYDKGWESHTHLPGRQWRLEWEAKHRLAPALWREVACHSADRHWLVRRLESSWRSAGYYLPWPDSEQGLPPVRREPAPEPSSAALAFWCMRTVRPALARLLRCFSVAEVLEMTGLSNVAQPIGAERVREYHLRSATRLRSAVAGDLQISRSGTVGTVTARDIGERPAIGW